ncbi:MmcQ/YjbR family DNA-binding protein [Herbiconiux sp. P15]|uniref:MmcQ/YjbR family DNA-binding protein n=1 Tax=Herbiconiux liukaitaii TaxID=3342799 RepID=UPI0035B831A0
MTRERLLEVCAGLPATTDERPFGPETAVFKVVGKVFALWDLESEQQGVTLKAQPAYIDALVRDHDWITRGYHMNKRHWISVAFTEQADPQLVEDLVVNSYDLVVAGLPRAKRP